MKIAGVIVAGGRGTRLGSLLPKAFVALAGKPLYQYSLETFLTHPQISEVILVLPEKAAARDLLPGVKVVPGGAHRQDSVYNGLMVLGPDVEGVLIHDAARPFVTPVLMGRLVEALRAGRNAIAAVPVSDTIKQVEREKIARTVDRQTLWQAQTPQAFLVPQLREAFAMARQQGWDIATDEAFLMEKCGGSVYVVEGEAQNLKITTPADLKLAEAIVCARVSS